MRIRIASALSAAALLVLTALPAGADSNGHSYLALGDSVAFGFNPILYEEQLLTGVIFSPGVFVGYPDTVARTFGMKLTNASCPGETSGGLIARTPAQDYLCLPYVMKFPLHTTYSGSQLEFAIHYLRTHPTVRLVTMDIGANDVFKCLGQPACAANGLPSVLATIDFNLRYIYGQIRNVAHYHHALVTLSYYSLSYDEATASGTSALNAQVIDATEAYGGIVASGFDAFKSPALATPDKSSCEAGLLIVTATNPLKCDVHPSPVGRDLLAAAIVKAVANSCPARSFNGCLDRNED